MASSLTRSTLMVAGGIVSGGLFAALVLDLGQPDPRVAAPDPSAEVRSALARLDERIEALGLQHTELMRRLNALDLAVLSGRSEAQPTELLLDDELEDPLDALRQDVAQLASAVRGGLPEATSEPLVAQVIEALEVVQDRQRAERDELRAELQAERIDRHMGELTETLGLDAYQAQKMRETLASAVAGRDALDDFEGTRDERRTARDALAEKTRSSVDAFLSPSQQQLLDDAGGLRLGGGPDFGRRGGAGDGFDGGRRGR